MGRAVRQFELIACKKRRHQVWNRRMKSLKTMACILSQKCGIEVAMFYSGPEGDLGSSKTVFSWPDDARECRRVIEKFRGKDVKEREKNENCLLGILKERKRKLEKLLLEVVADQDATSSPTLSEPENVATAEEQRLSIMSGGDDQYGFTFPECDDQYDASHDCNATEVLVVDGIFDGISSLECNSEVLPMDDKFEQVFDGSLSLDLGHCCNDSIALDLSLD